MAMKNSWLKSASLLAMLVTGMFLTGCATSSQLRELQMQVDQISQEAQHAADMAKDIESKCMSNKADAEEYYKAVQKAADRAEKAADRAASSEKAAMDAAKRAETSAEDTRILYDRMNAK
jgi:methyl-accepting chemotaxis protein